MLKFWYSYDTFEDDLSLHDPERHFCFTDITFANSSVEESGIFLHFELSIFCLQSMKIWTEKTLKYPKWTIILHHRDSLNTPSKVIASPYLQCPHSQNYITCACVISQNYINFYTLCIYHKNISTDVGMKESAIPCVLGPSVEG